MGPDDGTLKAIADVAIDFLDAVKDKAKQSGFFSRLGEQGLGLAYLIALSNMDYSPNGDKPSASFLNTQLDLAEMAAQSLLGFADDKVLTRQEVDELFPLKAKTPKVFTILTDCNRLSLASLCAFSLN